jgi:predicted transcriptional regulator
VVHLENDGGFTDEEINKLLATHVKRTLEDAIALNQTFEEFFSELLKKITNANRKALTEEDINTLRNDLEEPYRHLQSKKN